MHNTQYYTRIIHYILHTHTHNTLYYECTRSLRMHKILVHAQDSCACTTLLCMHNTLEHALEGPGTKARPQKKRWGSGLGQRFLLGPGLGPWPLQCMHKSVAHAQESVKHAQESYIIILYYYIIILYYHILLFYYYIIILLYGYIILIIINDDPPPCLQAQEACPIHPSCFSDLLRSGAVCSLVLRTQQVQGLIRTMTRFRSILHFFSETFF